MSVWQTVNFKLAYWCETAPKYANLILQELKTMSLKISWEYWVHMWMDAQVKLNAILDLKNSSVTIWCVDYSKADFYKKMSSRGCCEVHIPILSQVTKEKKKYVLVNFPVAHDNVK